MKINQENLKNLSKQSLFHYQKLFPVLSKEKNKQYGMLGLTFITLTVFGVFAINPTLTTIAELQKKVEDARFVEQQLSQKILNLQSLRSQYDALQNELIYVEQALPTKPQPVKFIGQIRTIAALTNVQLKSFQIVAVELTDTTSDEITEAEKTQPFGNTIPYTFSLEVIGSYSQVREFLTVLTGFDRLTTVETINVSRDSSGSQTISLELDGTAYYKP